MCITRTIVCTSQLQFLLEHKQVYVVINLHSVNSVDFDEEVISVVMNVMARVVNSSLDS